MPHIIRADAVVRDPWQDEFAEHVCADYPLTLKEQLKRAEGWENDQQERNRVALEESLKRKYAEERKQKSQPGY